MKQNHYEKLIEYILNDETDKAREVFHNIVVSRSRQIYENMMQDDPHSQHMGELEDDVTQEQIGEEDDEAFPSNDQAGNLGDELTGDDNMKIGNNMDNAEMGGDEFGGDAMGAEGGEGAIEDRVMDLEDALDELKAEFDALMSGEQGEEHDHPGMHDMGGDDMAGEEDAMYEAKDEEDDEEEDEDGEEKVKESRTGRKMTEAEWIREYVEKIGDYPGEQGNPNGKMAGTGAKSEKQGERNTKSPVGPGTDMGGTNKNIARGGANVDPDGKQIEQPSNEYAKGRGQLKDAGKFANVPGGNAGKTSYKTKEGEYSTEHSKEGKLAGADGSRPINKKSPVAK